MASAPGDATAILASVGNGDAAAAARLLPLVYDELRALAGRQMQRESPGQTLQPTALVHEAYLRLVDQTRVDWKGRAHFCAVAATMMRRVLVEHARARNRRKRGEDWQQITLEEADPASDGPDRVDLLALDEALTRLAKEDEREARVVELRYFAGLDVEQTAIAMDVSPRLVEQDWAMAKVWLKRELSRGDRT